MRNQLYILVIIFWGCNVNNPEETRSEVSVTAPDEKYSQTQTGNANSLSYPFRAHKNIRDARGFKQGTWDFIENGKVKGFESYFNDTLDGSFRHWNNYPGQISQGQYSKGLKAGIWKHIDNDTNLVMVVRYQDGTVLWAGYPYADSEYHTPVKGFNLNADSLMIECPYLSDTIWYRGVFINKKPVGLHYMYYPSGNLKFQHDYSTDMVKVFDPKGRLIEEKMGDMRSAW